MYERISFLIYSSTSVGWPWTGTFVMPGKSTNVRSTTFGEKIVRLIGLSESRFPVDPANLSVWASISVRIKSKLVNLTPFLCRNSPHSYWFLSSFTVLLSESTSGHLVTIPVPLGKKSLPTIDSITELFPLD